MKTEGALIYNSIFEAAEALPDAQRLAFYDAVMRNRFAGVELSSPDPVINAMLKLLAPVFEKSDKRAEAGRRGGEAKNNTAGVCSSFGNTKSEPNENQTETKGEPIKDKGLRIKDKGIYVSDNAPARVRETPQDPEDVDTVDSVDTVDKPKRQTFKTPTTADVYEYAEEAGLQIDAEAFCDFYASKGWKVGKETMKDWRAAARNWARRDREDRNRKNTKADSFRPRTVFHGMEDRRESYETLIPSKYA